MYCILAARQASPMKPRCARAHPASNHMTLRGENWQYNCKTLADSRAISFPKHALGGDVKAWISRNVRPQRGGRFSTCRSSRRRDVSGAPASVQDYKLGQDAQPKAGNLWRTLVNRRLFQPERMLMCYLHLQRGGRRDVSRAPAPAHVCPFCQDAQPGAGNIQQNPVKRLRSRGHVLG